MAENKINTSDSSPKSLSFWIRAGERLSFHLSHRERESRSTMDLLRVIRGPRCPLRPLGLSWNPRQGSPQQAPVLLLNLIFSKTFHSPAAHVGRWNVGLTMGQASGKKGTWKMTKRSTYVVRPLLITIFFTTFDSNGRRTVARRKRKEDVETTR